MNAVVRNHLERLASKNDKRAEARRTSRSRLASGYAWDREELYDRCVLRGREHPYLRGEDNHGQRYGDVQVINPFLSR